MKMRVFTDEVPEKIDISRPSLPDKPIVIDGSGRLPMEDSFPGSKAPDWILEQGKPDASIKPFEDNTFDPLLRPFDNDTFDPSTENGVVLGDPAKRRTTMEWNALDPSDGRSDTMEWRFLEHGEGEAQNLGGESSKEWNGLDVHVSNLDNEATVLHNNPEFA